MGETLFDKLIQAARRGIRRLPGPEWLHDPVDLPKISIGFSRRPPGRPGGFREEAPQGASPAGDAPNAEAEDDVIDLAALMSSPGPEAAPPAPTAPTAAAEGAFPAAGEGSAAPSPAPASAAGEAPNTAAGAAPGADAAKGVG